LCQVITFEARRSFSFSLPLQFSVRVTRETSPEAIDKLQRRKLELEVEIHALEREKDEASKERLQLARKVSTDSAVGDMTDQLTILFLLFKQAIADVEDHLRPLQAAYEAEKRRGDEVNEVRKKIDDLKAKADDAERR
jgi:ATP-dependent Clp protease ATP-binding subunit ClpB